MAMNIEYASAMLSNAEFDADIILVAPIEFEVTRAQRTYREKNFTTFTELLSMGAFQSSHVQRINEALGLEALAAYLKDEGLKTAIINCNISPHSVEEVVHKVKESGAKIVGISLIYRPQVAYALDLIKVIRQMGLLVNVVMGGALASYMPRELLSRLRGLDAVVFGEAEETFRDYCRAIFAHRDPNILPGVAYLQDGKPVLSPAAPPLNLAEIKRPMRQSLEFLRARGWATNIASIYTSRGCLAKCTFCTGKDAYNVERRITYRYRDPVDVVNEIEYLKSEFGVKFVYVNDDNFLGYGKKSRERIERFATELIERNLQIQFATECRVDGIDKDILKLLRQAGMRQVLLGLESGSNSTLKRWRKGATVEQNHKAVKLCQQAGVTLEPGFILFDAETTQSELAENLDFIRQARFDEIPFPNYLINRLTVYPGTEIERQWTEKGILAPSPIPAQRTVCPSDRIWIKLWRDGSIARDAPAVGGGAFVDDPQSVLDYFQRLEYVCEDPRTETAWRGIRHGLEPVEVFLESRLPGIISILAECRGQDVPEDMRDTIRQYIHKAARWRQGVGKLIIDMLECTLKSYEIPGGVQQLRWIRNNLNKLTTHYNERTLNCSHSEFENQVMSIRQQLIPLQASVIIPTCGKWSRLKLTLQSLQRQHIPEGLQWEILLVLDGIEVQEGFLEPFTSSLPINLLHLEKQSGRGAARNAGVRAARAEVVILLDDDIIVSPTFVVSHLESQAIRSSLCHGPLRELPPLVYFDNLETLSMNSQLQLRKASARAAEVCRKILSQLDQFDYCWEQYSSASRMEEDGEEAFKKGRTTAMWLGFSGANISAPRKWFLSAPFDESPGTKWGLEDIALAGRWLSTGRPLTIADQAKGIHLSHYRENWRANMRSNIACLNFLQETSRSTVLDYLEGKTEYSTVESAIQHNYKQRIKTEEIAISG